MSTVPPPPTNGLAIAALVLGLLSFICLGPIGGAAAVIFGILGLKKANEVGTGRGMSIAGIILGILGTIVSVALTILLVVGLDQASDLALDEIDDLGGIASLSDYEIEETTCEVDDLGIASYEGTIENTSSESKGFTINTEIKDADTGRVLDTSSVTKDEIPPGATEEWAIVATGLEPEADVTCRIVTVNNFFN
jgi:hypothetical protein